MRRIVDWLKILVVCFAAVVFFAFLARSCDDDDYEAAYEDAREAVWDEAYNEGLKDGASSGEVQSFRGNHSHSFESSYDDGKHYYEHHVKEMFFDYGSDFSGVIIDYLWGDMGEDLILYINEHYGRNYQDVSGGTP